LIILDCLFDLHYHGPMFFILSSVFGGVKDPDDPENYAALIAENLGFIEDRCRRAYGIASRWQESENLPAANRADSLLVEVLDHLKADGFRVLREYKGRSSIRRYLEVVIANKVVDLYRAREGRSRAAEEARKLGDYGVRLYELVFMDGLPVEEAQRVMAAETGYAGGLERLEDMADRIRAKMTRSHVEVPIGRAEPQEAGRPSLRVIKDDSGDIAVPDESLGPERVFDESRRHAARVSALREIASILTPQERLMAKMRFNGGMKVKDIAAALGINEKSAYRAFENMLARCKAVLQEKGLSAEDLL
jgi:RNA polymerase sigma factor (sigma-70 family)